MTGTTYRDAMRALIGARWEDVWKAVPRAVEGTDIEGVHDVRVASRRLRAAMDVAAPAFPASWYKPLHTLAKEITSELGAVRDRDVMLEYLRAEREAAPPNERPGIDRLIARVDRERVAARAEMESFLANLAERNIREETRRRFPLDESDGKP
ncbi:MAG: CHAD domain-containing protein [Thermomicrobiales bacterium]